MTRQEANKIKKVLNGDYRVYYKGETEELRVIVYTYYEKYYRKDVENIEILKLLNRVSKSGHRPKFEIAHKTYQGFINNTYVVFK